MSGQIDVARLVQQALPAVYDHLLPCFGVHLFWWTPHAPQNSTAKGAGKFALTFVNDDLGAAVVSELADLGVRMIALRSVGFNHVDLRAAHDAGIQVARVPAYSPHAVAEHTVALILTLNRKTHRAWNRVREGNFALDGLMGFDMHGKVAGIIGTGLIGAVLARILAGFGCEILACDPRPNVECVNGARCERMTHDA